MKQSSSYFSVIVVKVSAEKGSLNVLFDLFYKKQSDPSI